MKHSLHLFLALTILVVGCGMTAPNPAAAYTLAAPQATTYYVATTGDNDNDGSLAHPWRTIQYAVNTVQPGDTILVLSGTYVGARIEQSGAATAWITLQAASGENVLINTPGPNNKHDSNLEIETWEGNGTVAYWVVQGFEVGGAPGAGIDIRGSDPNKSHHITIRGNTVHDNGTSDSRTGIFAAFTDDVLIEGNESYNNSEHGVYVNNSSDRFTVRGNRLHHNHGCGLHLNGDASMGGDGIMSGGLIENNIIYENGADGGAGINMDGVTTTVARNNLLYNNRATGIAIFQGDGAVCSHSNSFLHNTILMPSDGRWAILIADSACTHNKVFNNILYSSHSYRGSIDLPASSVSGFESDYNVVVNRFTTDDGETVITLAQWQALGYDTHSFLATPAELFVDAANHNYHLRDGSPAIDAGRTGLEVNVDIQGQPRPMESGYDIGAYEHGGPAYAYLPIIEW